MIWFQRTTDKVLKELGASSDGLSKSEAQKRRRQYGPNRIKRGKKVSVWQILLHQFTSPLIYVLLGALIVTAAIQSWNDVIVIAAVLVINATIGFIQEYRAESAVEALMQMITPKATVIRDGRQQQIDSKKLVPGDVVVLGQGQTVPADVRLTDVQGLQINESALTGESVPANKISDAMPGADENIPPADQQNMAFMSTAVTSGEGRGVVVAIGGDTEIGKIAQQVQEAGETQTPLERRIRSLAKYITIGVLIAAVIAIIYGWAVVGNPFYDMLLLGVALAVAAIPGGLPIVVTVALAIGVERMAKRHAVIRNLPAVDTLGSTTLIVSDKTGTMTQNQMTVRAVGTGDSRYDITGGGLSLSGRVEKDGEQTAPEEGSALWYTLLTGLLCNDAELEPKQQEHDDEEEAYPDDVEGRGDPLEVALLVAAHKGGLDREAAQKRFPRQDVVPFSSDRRYMATIHRSDDGPLVLVKGAPERVLEMCDHALDPQGNPTDLDADRVREQSEDMAGEGLRMLAMAMGRGDDAAQGVKREEPQGLTFLGVQGLLDPPRESVIRAVDQCHEAGLRVVMVTGDHARTAAAIAQKTHLDRPRLKGEAPETEARREEAQQDTDVLPEAHTGTELADKDDAQFDDLAQRSNVFARVAPAQKTRLVNRLKENNEIVAVTGDGVNDAPALKAAHIGAAMGAGTDVAKQASDMVITDNNFASVYAAVEEGRTAFRNIRMATFFLLSTGAADVLIILSALVIGWPLPLLPAQILWCNVVTNGIADVALAFEPGEKALFQRPPRPPSEGILDRTLIERLVIVGIWLATGVLGIFYWLYQDPDSSMTIARTGALTTLVLFQKVHVFNCRSEDVSIFKKSLWANKLLFIGVLTSLAVHIGALYWPVTQELLRVKPLNGTTWLAAIGVALTAIIVNELHKKLRPTARSSRRQ